MIKFAILALFILPPIFQLIFGSKATKGSYSFKFWKICLISLIALVLASIMNVFLMTEIINQSGSRDGLPIIGLLAVEVIIGLIIILMILIQLYIKHRRKITS